MKAAVCEEPRRITVRDVRIPEPDADEALVRVRASGISGSDVRVYMGRHTEVVYPMILGHEFSGEVNALGGDVEDFEIGDEVIVEPLFMCGKCPACLAGDYNLCNELMLAGYHVPGSFAQYAIAKTARLYHKDRSLSFDEAVLIEPLAIAVHAVKRAGINVGDIVVVLGTGAIGLLAVQVARKAGAKVVAADLSSEKLHLAADLGADYVVVANTSELRELVMAMTRGTGVDVVMECAGAAQAMAQTVNLVRKGGTIVMVGWTGSDSDYISLTKITMNEISLLGSAIYCRDFPTAVELAVSGDVNLKSMISHTFELSQVGEALEEMSQDQHHIIKAVVKFPEQEDWDEQNER